MSPTVESAYVGSSQGPPATYRVLPGRRERALFVLRLDLDLEVLRLAVTLVREAAFRDLDTVFAGAFAELFAEVFAGAFAAVFAGTFADAFCAGFETAVRLVEVLDLAVAP